MTREKCVQAGAAMTDALDEMLDDQGLPRSTAGYAREHLLCNWLVTGKRSPFQPRTPDEFEALTRVRKENTQFILAGIPFAERRARLKAKAIREVRNGQHE